MFSTYDKIIRAINSRSNTHLVEVQPKLEKAGVVHDREYLSTDIERVLGNRLFVTMTDLTDSIILVVDEAIHDVEMTADKLTTLLLCAYPGQEIIRFANQDEDA